MEYVASAETYQKACDVFFEILETIQPKIEKVFQGSEFSEIEVKVRYIPIIMPEEVAVNYPARSKTRIQARIVDVAPQLDYDVFTFGSFEQSVDVYIRGLVSGLDRLRRLGVDEAKISSLKASMLSVREIANSDEEV